MLFGVSGLLLIIIIICWFTVGGPGLRACCWGPRLKGLLLGAQALGFAVGGPGFRVCCWGPRLW